MSPFFCASLASDAHGQAARADTKKQKQAAANAAKKARRAARAAEETVENGSAK